ncbi:acyl carrier protein, mitochondrial-like [Phoenix dactylifera]|uniref:Acyl carrier protein n=1 Tax=Phoenix dactylifera TaxID=42345 RepID=A0A8B7BS45_PHODC|nr:acyl carrier protein, mitochondrial-like [Phoenix dactylifera]
MHGLLRLQTENCVDEPGPLTRETEIERFVVCLIGRTVRISGRYTNLQAKAFVRPISLAVVRAELRIHDRSIEMQAARNAIRLIRSFPPRPPPPAVGGGAAGFSQSSAAPAAAVFLDKQDIADRVVHLLRSCPFVDPSKVSPTTNFKNDLQLDMLENVEVMVAVEEEFAVEIPDGEADKISSAAHLIDYIAAHPQAK